LLHKVQQRQYSNHLLHQERAITVSPLHPRFDAARDHQSSDSQMHLDPDVTPGSPYLTA
jgi:hypothetical protein